MGRKLCTASPLDFEYDQLLGMGGNGFVVAAKSTVRRGVGDCAGWNVVLELLAWGGLYLLTLCMSFTFICSVVWLFAHGQLPLFPRADDMTFAVKGLFNYRAVTSKILRSKMENEVSMAAELWLVRLRDVSLWYMR